MKAAYKTGKYRNVFLELGYDEKEIEERKEAIFQTLFYGAEDERIYFPVGDDMGYMKDTGNDDARTEGMSYGMMMCVQMNKKEEFDRLWKWSKTYMYLSEGPNAGYFAWSCKPNGEKNAYGAAPDGEEYFVMALIFASKRWGNGEGIFNYEKEAKDILHTMIHKGEKGEPGRAMFAPENKYIRFIVEVDFTDPSYHLPHFYELCAEVAYDEDKAFMKEAAIESRKYLRKACHPKTGLSAEYAEYDGAPYTKDTSEWGGRHDWYYSDAYRTICNISLDYSWFAADEWQVKEAECFQRFFCETLDGKDWDHIYLVDGTKLEQKVLHPVAVIATNAYSALITDTEYGKECVRRFWETPLRKGERRYYDNCLYFFAYLALSGNYRIF